MNLVQFSPSKTFKTLNCTRFALANKLERPNRTPFTYLTSLVGFKPPASPQTNLVATSKRSYGTITSKKI